MKKYLCVCFEEKSLERIKSQQINLKSWALRFSPFLSVISPPHDALILDLTGTEKLYKHDRFLLRRIVIELRALNLIATLAIAPTIGAAWALAKYSKKRTIIATPYNLIQLLLPLPLSSLRIDSETISLLHSFGITNIEFLLKLPRLQLASRFGVKLLTNLDRALGAVDEPLTFEHPTVPLLIQKRMEFALTKQDSLAKMTLFLCSTLINRLQNQELVASSFIFLFECLNTDNSNFFITKELSLHSAIRDLKHLSSIIRPVLESIRAPAGVKGIAIEALNVERQNKEQQNYLHREEQNITAGINELLDHFVNRLRKENVLNVFFKASHIPERSFAFYSVNGTGFANKNSLEIIAKIPKERPPCILSKPQEITAIAMLPDRPPALIIWHHERYKINQAIGPERVSLEWWHTAQGSVKERDYFKVQDETGRWLWIFRDNSPYESSEQWFVHGLWV